MSHNRAGPAAPHQLSSVVAPAELERLRGGLRIIALRALGDPDAADDAVQETLARAIVALEEGRLTDLTRLGAYVAGIARHVCSHMLRDRKDVVPLHDVDGSVSPSADPRLATRHDPLEALITAAEHDRLRAAFLALSSADQHLLRLCFAEERSPSEVADALAEPPERIRKRKSRALDRLRRAFIGGHDEAASGTIRGNDGD